MRLNASLGHPPRSQQFIAVWTMMAISICPAIAVADGFAHFAHQGPRLLVAGAYGRQGYSVAVSADGNTAIVGAHEDYISGGAVWVWTRSGGSWTQQAKLFDSGSRFGIAVSLSADGNTALVGADFDNASAGAAWVWTRSAGVWTKQGPKLVGTGAVGSAHQGRAVALSADGNTAFVGGPDDNSYTGATWVWVRTNGVWAQQGSKLVGTGAVGANTVQGGSIAVSADGNTAVVGGYGDDSYKGAAWVWTRDGSEWTQQGGKLVGAGTAGAAGQGYSVSLSADGNTALVGGLYDNSSTGAAWVWTRSGGVWSQQGPKLVGSYVGGSVSYQGWSVSLSGDGNSALIGGPGGAGGAWIWNRTASIWTQLGTKLTPGLAGFLYSFGASVSFSSDGRTAIVGGPGTKTENTGGAWAFIARGPLDFEGDVKTDFTVFRPATGIWYSALSGGGARATTWGISGDLDVAADYDGDGMTDIGVWRPSTGTWFIVHSSDDSVHVTTFGADGDIPLAGDVDRDGRADLVVFRPTNGSWLFNKSTGGTSLIWWGMSGDQPLLGDYNGDGIVDATIYRPANGGWYAYMVGANGFLGSWGAPGDTPVVGDWDGDGISDTAVFRPGTGQWFVNKSTGGTLVATWGTSDDVPVSGDWDDDGKSDFTVWRESAGVWYTQFATGGAAAVGWGITGDKPSGRVPGS